MARSTGIILTAGGISYANNWVQQKDQHYQQGGGDLKILVATLGAALVFAGLEEINETVAVGLAWIVLVTVLVLPPKGMTAPLQTLGNYGKKQ